MRRELIDQNEQRYGAEARTRWGDDAVDASNQKLLDLNDDEYRWFQELGAAINAALEAAVQAHLDPAGDEGARIHRMHREWLGFTWNFYTPEAHRGLAEMYTADERFTRYYDGNTEGCAVWLRDAILAHAA